MSDRQNCSRLVASIFALTLVSAFAFETMVLIRGKLRSGSPPWNSILIRDEGLANAISRERIAVSSLISNRERSVLWRETWQ